METNELFTKDSLLYKKNGRYKNLIKAYDLYVNSLITNNSMTINDIFIANTTCADLIRFVCYKPKMKCYRKSFIEYYNKIAKMYNALDHLSDIHTVTVITEGEEDNE